MNQQMGADLTVDEVVVELKRRIMKSEKPYDLDAVDRAIQLACKAHEGQKRSSGEDYVCHPLLVACILVDLGMDSETIVASILIMTVQNLPMSAVLFETCSAMGTSGMSTGVTRSLNTFSRFMIIMLMYCGRIGSLSFALAFTRTKRKPHVQLPSERITVG